MQFDYRMMMDSEEEARKVDASLDEYLALDGDSLTRLKYKRKGRARESMAEALAQMAMLFAAANMGDDAQFAECMEDVLGRALSDDPARRALRVFYLRNVSRVPGTLEPALARLVLARPKIMDAPLGS